jgi:hypothetical protein
MAHGYRPQWSDDTDDRTPSRRYQADLEKLIETEQPQAILCFCASNYLFTFGTFKSPRPFDFIVPGREDLAVTPDAEIIPYGLMKEAAAAAAPWWPRLLTLACGLYGVPVYSVCLPPPAADLSAILADMKDPGTRARFERFGVASSAFRYKMWHIQAETDRVKAASAGAEFLPPPAKALDEAGLLRAELSQDIVHGNTAYGHWILEQVTDLVLGIPGKES